MEACVNVRECVCVRVLCGFRTLWAQGLHPLNTDVLVVVSVPEHSNSYKWARIARTIEIKWDERGTECSGEFDAVGSGAQPKEKKFRVQKTAPFEPDFEIIQKKPENPKTERIKHILNKRQSEKSSRKSSLESSWPEAICWASRFLESSWMPAWTTAHLSWTQ